MLAPHRRADLVMDIHSHQARTAAYARIYNSGGTTCYFQGLCGTATSDFILNNLVIQAGGVVSCSSLKIRLPRE